MSASDHLAGAQFAPVFRDVSKEYPGHGVITQKEQVPRHVETGAPPSIAYRYAHYDAVKQYQREGVPRGTYFSIDLPDARYRASDHELISVPYSDQHFRSSVNLYGDHYLSTTSTVPPDQLRRHSY